MKDWKAISLITIAFLALIRITVYIDAVYSEKVIDIEKEAFAATLFVIGVYTTIIVLCLTVAPLLRQSKHYLLSSILVFFGSLTANGIYDELFAQDPSRASNGEYFWAVASLVFAVFNYFNIKPLEKLWNFIKNRVCNKIH